jgi:hypothetical protein
MAADASVRALYKSFKTEEASAKAAAEETAADARNTIFRQWAVEIFGSKLEEAAKAVLAGRKPVKIVLLSEAEDGPQTWLWAGIDEEGFFLFKQLDPNTAVMCRWSPMEVEGFFQIGDSVADLNKIRDAEADVFDSTEVSFRVPWVQNDPKTWDKWEKQSIADLLKKAPAPFQI